MTKYLEFIASAIRGQLVQFPALTGLGVLGLTLGAMCMAGALARGVEVPPEGNLIETATFNGSVGLFVLTLAVLAPGVKWTRRGRRTWMALLVGLTLYAYGIETIQAFRGLDPRFSRVAGLLDQAAGGVFFLTALGIMSCFLVLAAKYFRAPASPMTVAVRYGATASVMAFGVGIWMSVVTQGRHVPGAGNLLVVHAAGFHGLQVVPLVAFLAQRAEIRRSVALRRVHLAGLTWLGACVAITWQSGSGRPIAELSPATAVTALCLLAFSFTGMLAVRSWLRSSLEPAR